MTKPLNILMLEDDVPLQRALTRLLKRGGHTVTVVGTVPECRNLLSEVVPDVLLLDREVAGQDGWSLRHEVPDSVRVVLMTGSPPPDAPPHLVKPMPAKDLLGAVEGAI